ncbi:MAG: lysozyme [Alphaproteobacteria bacterium]
MALLKQFEGFSPTIYKCPAGLPTIGYGHVIKASETFPDRQITQKQAEILLKQDVNVFLAAVREAVTVEINQNQLDALVCLAYNIGIQAFEKSTLLRHLNAGNAPKAAMEFRKWVFCKGQRLPGLLTRRNAEANLFTRKRPFMEL